MPVTVIVGEQRGDEGKGRFVDMLAKEHDIVARFNGGNNAGHTVVTDDGHELDLHGIPSGIAYEHTVNVIGRGCLINALALDEEANAIRSKGFEVSPDNLRISSGAHLILPHHKIMDAERELSDKKQGSTGSGIAPVAADKYMREGLRAEIINNDLDKLANAVRDGLVGQEKMLLFWERIVRIMMSGGKEGELPAEIVHEFVEETTHKYTEASLDLGAYITDTDIYIDDRLENDPSTRVLAEGAQAFWLDVDHGMWPYVTSSSTTAGGVANGLGIPPQKIDRVVGVSKLVQSHVGGGPFVTEIFDEDLLENLHGDISAVDGEKGTTTGRKRRLGYLDIPAIRRSQRVNGTSEVAVTKLDWVSRYGDTIPVCVAYERKGKQLKKAPDAAYKLEQSTPQYVELPGWKEDIQDVRRFEDLPENAQNYIRFIEDQMGLPVTMIGVGPGRDQVIDRR